MIGRIYFWSCLKQIVLFGVFWCFLGVCGGGGTPWWLKWHVVSEPMTTSRPCCPRRLFKILPWTISPTRLVGRSLHSDSDIFTRHQRTLFKFILAIVRRVIWYNLPHDHLILFMEDFQAMKFIPRCCSTVDNRTSWKNLPLNYSIKLLQQEK